MKVQGGGGSQRMGTSLDAKAVLERQRWLKVKCEVSAVTTPYQQCLFIHRPGQL